MVGELQDLIWSGKEMKSKGSITWKKRTQVGSHSHPVFLLLAAHPHVIEQVLFAASRLSCPTHFIFKNVSLFSLKLS